MPTQITARIFTLDNQPITQDVPVLLDEKPSEWSGIAYMPEAEAGGLMGVTWVMRFDDGREGKIVVHNRPQPHDERLYAVYFDGLGDLPSRIAH